MIVALEGEVAKKNPTYIVLKTVSGVSYGVYVSLFCSNQINQNGKIELLITQIIKEDSHKLYGFLDDSEQKMFELLIKINGIGATTAMAVCSSLSVDAFYMALKNADESAFKKVPGIGAKGAKRIITELSDAKMNISNCDLTHSQALAALISLGFKQENILKALSSCQSTETGELVKEALKKLA
ncbi:Holliday junction branch migration protein RuvA [Campylobacter insulaenigrae]|uniref:Holliday junction branch migration complex subunit RuvA n=1 Tax=Campylobacter insulaenigrae NCTC 12927 TaxID=1031564 RepID=A0A0A8H3X1_9BACT|nr:Holliday junction branch migration protein RuvA [Campylobacter insulaenigrae]AJC87579.1 RuvABC resolvasome, subunit RuvA [Campylobacter insulaenigrae NCTC 12927]MCR6590566.1 Holliday junction branch migration protein RuvA [Campylobacter insulaenigrae]MCR6592103.1 Holliday junction branch migration protein RuvA [Campylobacter insulaenigrae]VEH93695.1 Holliday junction DNA helicase RuvA [Campylobacter insulaenigrae]VEJ53453.1 Holliday junction DNA helicase RuvA [Campylobacter insulaenigrae]